MKRLLLFTVILVIALAGAAWAQDCGACPSKATCGKVKPADPAVFVAKAELAVAESLFHKKECVKLGAEKVELKLSEALKANHKPCPVCFPPPPEKKGPDSQSNPG